MSAAGKFLIGIFAGALGLAFGLALLFVGLDVAGKLKAPAFANRLSFDEKLRVLRADPPQDVDVLCSPARRPRCTASMVSCCATELGLEGDVLNLGVQDLRVNQIKFLVDVFLTGSRRSTTSSWSRRCSTTRTAAASRPSSSIPTT